MLKAPIANVPAEILGEIFNSLFIGTLVVPSANFATLWSVSQTCSQWRGVVLGLRYLWNDVAVGAPAHLHECRPIFCLADQCLARTRGTFISIQLYESPLWGIYGGALLTKLLIPHATKLRRLSLGTSVDLSKLVTPALEELETTFYGPGVAELTSLVERSKCTILRLSLDCAETGCYSLLKATPLLEELRTNNSLSPVSVRGISRGTVCPALRSIHCKIVTWKIFDEVIEMLTSRYSDAVLSRIADVSLLFDFQLGLRGARKIWALRDRGIHVLVTQSMKLRQDSDSDSDGPGGYNSDRVCSLIFR